MKKFLVAFVAIAAVSSCSIYQDYMSMPNYLSGDIAEIGDIGEVGDKFDEIVDNEFIDAAKQPQSTFSVDADGAAYSYMMTCLRKGWRPSKNSVRIEEYLNYFPFEYADPDPGQNIALNGEVAPCPWAGEHYLMRLGIKGKSLKQSEMPAANFVFLIDVSGSMDSEDKLYLLKDGLSTMVDYLNPDDRVSIVTYSGNVSKVLESTRASDSNKIKKAIRKLSAGGSTAGGKGMKMAYEEALANFIEGGNNRVIMGTDGDFNVGVTSTDALLEMVQNYAKQGIYLTICGFGTGNLNDSMMEKVSNKGNGNYEYIGNEDDLIKVFIRERSKFVSVANDCKVQITFDSTVVSNYRLIGYENRVLNNDDFENDDVDAAEIGAGQTITALYEIIPTSGLDLGDKVATFDFRYKQSLSGQSIPLSIDVKKISTELSNEGRFAAGVASYGMVLRDSKYKGNSTFESARQLVNSALGSDEYGYRSKLMSMIEKASGIEQ